MADKQDKLARLDEMLSNGLVTVEEYDRIAAGLGIKAAAKSRTAKVKRASEVIGIGGFVLGAAADAAHLFYPALSGPLTTLGKFVGLIGSWF